MIPCLGPNRWVYIACFGLDINSHISTYAGLCSVPGRSRKMSVDFFRVLKTQPGCNGHGPPRRS